MTYRRTFTPPVASPVTLDCELVATRRPQNPNDPGAYTGPPDPQDIRGWLDVQTEAYRAAVRVQLTPATVSAWLLNEATDEQLKEVLDSNLPASAKERDSLKSQLSAAVAERDAAQAELGRLQECDTHAESVLDQIHELVWTGANRAKLDDLPGLVAALKTGLRVAERELTSARETIRKLEAEVSGDVGSELRAAQNVAASLQTELADLEREHERAKQRLGVQEQKIDAQRDQLRRENQSREKREARVYGLEKERDQLKETIRALTEERDARDRATWQRATTAQRHIHPLNPMASYEPPRSEERRPACDECMGSRLVTRNGRDLVTCPKCSPQTPAASRSDDVNADVVAGIAGALATNSSEMLSRVAAEIVRYGMSDAGGPHAGGHIPAADLLKSGSHWVGVTQPSPELLAAAMTGGPLPATRLAPLTDRERSIVAAAMAWYWHIDEHGGGFPGEIALRNKLAEACSDDEDEDEDDEPGDWCYAAIPLPDCWLGTDKMTREEAVTAGRAHFGNDEFWITRPGLPAEKVDAVDLPKTPDVRREEASKSRQVTSSIDTDAAICPYCHKPFLDDNDHCRLTHEHGISAIRREHHPTYGELEEKLRLATEQVERLRSEQPWRGVFRWEPWLKSTGSK